MGSDDALSRRDRGLEFLEVTGSLASDMDSPKYDAATRMFTQRVRLTNFSGTPVDGDLLVIVTQMPTGVLLMNAEGRSTRMAGMVGMPYLRLHLENGQLAAGASIPVDLQIRVVGSGTGSYAFRMLSGAGVP